VGISSHLVSRLTSSIILLETDDPHALDDPHKTVNKVQVRRPIGMRLGGTADQ